MTTACRVQNIAEALGQGCRSRRLAFLAICFGVWGFSVVAAAKDGAPEYRIKAAMVFKFLSYTQWPDSAFEAPDSPYRIWVLGASPISAELQEGIAGRLVNDRPVQVLTASSTREITLPHVVFVGHDAEDALAALTRRNKGKPLLVVTENEDGLAPGSTINLRLISGRVGFDVSLHWADISQLKLSSRLLAVASSVEREAH
ncbi:YfiR family protein [Allohahella sp. A8]|uniref:YfiR family protein n=1 Tax=Allohahella sp. A8 TaxID=3141461 RepID=UPI003A7F8BBE